jgi:hypothetical protein
VFTATPCSVILTAWACAVKSGDRGGGVRDLTEAQANACEQAFHPPCKCRCRGALHGARRLGIADPDADREKLRAIFSELPADDPHYTPPVSRMAAKRMLRDARHYLSTVDTGQRDLIALRDALYVLRVAEA